MTSTSEMLAPNGSGCVVDYSGEVARRIQLLNKLKEDPELMALEIEMCRRDAKHFVNNWGWTFDPRSKDCPANIPFVLFEIQKDLLDWIEETYRLNKQGLVEKSRDMGASWVFVAWFSHGFLFRGGFIGLFGSRKEDCVDDPSEDSLFGKVRYFIRHLPFFLKPENYAPKKHEHFLIISNPENNNRILGESANEDFGRSGRASAVLLDEGASIPNSERVLSSVSQVSRVIFWLSSPKGKNNAFYRLRHETNIRVFTMHWSRDPRKNVTWYESQKELLTPWEVAQEIDLSYDVDIGDKIYSRFSRMWHVARDPIEFNPDFEQWRAWDFGGTSPTAILWIQIAPGDIVQIYHTYELGGWDIDFHIPIALGRYPKEFSLLKKKERDLVQATLNFVPKSTEALTLFRDAGDNAGVARTANSKRSCKDALREAKIDLYTTGKQTYDWRYKCTDRLFRLVPVDAARTKFKSRLEISPTCVRFIDCLNNYVNDPLAQVKGEVKPQINWASHQVTAFEFFAINRFPIEIGSKINTRTFR